MKRVIVNADDFGINDFVTSEIERMINKGCVTSTTVMANGVCLEEVKKFVLLHPEVSFGIHLCLSEFDSITKSDSLFKAGLTDEKGKFIKKAIFHLNDYSDKNIRKAICEELNAQIDIVESLGIPISHADSHHHVHSILSLRNLFVDVLNSRGISKVRLGRKYNTLREKAHILDWFNRFKLNKYYRSCFKTTDAFYSYSSFVKYGMSNRQEDIVEVMCHPGHLAETYRKEMELVENRLINKENEVQFISYNEL